MPKNTPQRAIDDAYSTIAARARAAQAGGTVTPVTDHNALGGLQGGATGEYYHLSSADYTNLTDGGDTTLHQHARYLDAQAFVDIGRQGFVDMTSTSVSFSDSTYVFTLTDAGAGWSYYRAGIKYTIAGSKTVTLPGTPPTAGIYYIYIDATDGTLTQSTTAWTLLDNKVPVASVMWNSSLTPKYWLADERHTALMDARLQYYLHAVEGAGLITMPALSGYTVATDTDAAKTFAISAGSIIDQDIIITLDALADPDGTAAAYAVFYRTAAAAWAWALSAMPFPYSATYIQYDNAGTLTTGQANKYYNSYLLLTNMQGAARFVLVPGRGEFANLAAAQDENLAGFAWDGFSVAESIIAYRLTWNTNASYSSKGKCRLSAAPELIQMATVTNTTPSSGTEYLLVTGARTGATAQAQAFTYPVIIPGVDAPLVHATDSSHFNDNAATYPAGWTEVTAALDANTNSRLGYWYLSGSPTVTAWKYRRRLEALAAGTTSIAFGPILYRDPIYTADVTYVFGMYADDGAGNIVESQYIATELNYSAALNVWRVRGTRSNGTTTAQSSYYALGTPPMQGLYLRISTTGNNKRAHFGQQPVTLTQTTLYNLTFAITWNTPWVQISMSRGAGLDDIIYFGGWDRTTNV